MGNSTGVRVNREKQYRMMEGLPRRVRYALAHADFNWTVNSLLADHKAGSTPDTLIALVRGWDLEKAAADRTKVWGITKAMEAAIERRS